MSLLVWVAARKGIPATASWHDPAGVTILVACFLGLWGLGEWFWKRQKVEAGSQKPAAGIWNTEGKISNPGIRPMIFALAAWFLLTETGVETWYRWHEARLPAAQQWTVVWPANGTKELAIPASARQILRYNEGRSAAWPEDGQQWQAIFLRWNPGSAALHLAQNHTPEVCLTAAGHTLVSVGGLQWFDIHGLRLPFRIYEVADLPRPFYVGYCLWDDRASAQGFETASLDWGSRLAPVRAGLRNPGQRSLEIAVNGVDNANEAGNALRAELEKIVTVTK
jgi:hypothetical protein